MDTKIIDPVVGFVFVTPSKILEYLRSYYAEEIVWMNAGDERYGEFHENYEQLTAELARRAGQEKPCPTPTTTMPAFTRLSTTPSDR